MFDRAVLNLDDSRRFLVACIAYSLLDALAAIGMAVFLAESICGIWAGDAWEDCLGQIALFALCFIAKALFEFMQNRTCSMFAREETGLLRTRFLESLYSLGPLAMQSGGSAGISVETVSGIEKVEQYLAAHIPKTVNMVVVPLLLAICVYTQDVVSGIIITVAYPLIILFMRLIGFTAKEDSRKRHDGFMRMSDHFADAVRGLPTLRAFGVQRLYSKTVFAASEAYRKMTMKTLRIATLSSTVLDIFATCSLAAVAIMLGFRMVEGSVGFLPALTVLVLVPEFFRPIRRFASDYHATLDGKSSLDYVQETIAKADEAVKDTVETSSIEDAIRVESAVRNVLQCSAGAQASNTLSLKNISYSYGEGADILKAVSFEVSCGDRIALTGPSGCGKTTLLNLVAGMANPRSGAFFAGDTEILGLDRPVWKARVAFIAQDPYIFNATVRDNVRFYYPDADDSRIWDALERVCMADAVRDLPFGLDTVLGKGGVSLSGGQMQRIALARAIIDERRDIWVLDEPTEHLDIETELELKALFADILEGKTVFMSTHRKSWLDIMDTVIRMDGGRIKAVEHCVKPHDSRADAPHAECICNMPDAEMEIRDGMEEAISEDASGGAGNGTGVCRSGFPVSTHAGKGFAAYAVEGYRRTIVLICILGVVANLFAGGLMFTSGFMISLAATIPFTVLALHLPSIFVRIFGVGKPLIDYVQRLAAHNWILAVTSRMRVNLFDAADRCFDMHGKSAGNTTDAAGFLAVFSDAIEGVQNLYIRGRIPMLCVSATAVLLCAVLFAFSASMGAVFAICILLIVAVIPAVSVLQERRISQGMARLRLSVLEQAADDVFGLRDWVLSGRMADYVHQSLDAVRPLDIYRDSSVASGRTRTLVCNVLYCALAVCMIVWSSSVFGANPSGESVLSAWLSSVCMHDAQPYPPNWVAAFVLCLFPLAEVFFPMSEYAIEVQRQKAVISASGIDGIAGMSKPEEGDRDPYPAPSVNDCSGISLHDVSFAYPSSNRTALSIRDLHIPEGQHVAVIGRSGSGKSTLAKLISGQIGEAESRSGDMRHTCAFLDQNPHIFSQSLRDNLIIGKTDATDAQLVNALSSVGLGYLVSSREGGLDMMVAESGRNLSGGERERIALGRVLLSDRDIFVLDEPFAGLDQPTADAITEMLLDIFSDKTIVMVTHNLSMADRFDRIIMLDEGRIALDGSCEELAASDAYFAELLHLSR